VGAFKRHIFYLGGFDPRGSRHYHAMLREAAAKRARLTGEAATVGERVRAGPHLSECAVTGPDAATRYTFLEWDDLVRDRWTRGPLRLLVRAAAAYRGQLAALDRAAVRRLPRGPLIAFAYAPAGAVLLPALLGLGFALAMLAVLPVGIAWPLGMLAGAAAAAAPLRRARAGWMLRFAAFNWESGGGVGDPAVAARLDRFAGAVGAVLDDPDADEVLLVTHSNGSILAVPLVARLLAARGHALPDRFTLVTLGQCVPLMLVRTDAGGRPFRDALALVGRGHFHWLDIGSPRDGAAFHAVDPFALAGMDRRCWLEQLSPRFHLFRDAPASAPRGWSKWATKYEAHFDYLRTGDRPSPLDLVALATAPVPVDRSVDAFRALP